MIDIILTFCYNTAILRKNRLYSPKGPFVCGPERNAMRDYIIMTDSCCDLNQQEVDELGLTVLPLSFTIDGKTYLNTPDHAEMSPEEFFAKIAAGENSTTAAANVGQFDEAMRRALDAGKDILCICFSGALSTTYQSARIAAEDLKSEYPDAKILVIDSLSASRGQGMLLYRTVQERRRSSPDIETLGGICEEHPPDPMPLVHRGRSQPPQARRPRERHGRPSSARCWASSPSCTPTARAGSFP